jgi:uncharacterized protein YndB with AHSA1/START domain
MDFDGFRDIDASGDAVWAVVADPKRLPEWLPTVATAHVPGATGGSSIELEGESHGHTYSLTSMWRADDAVHRLEWAGAGSDAYKGSLRVLDRAVGSSGVKVHITVPDERVASSPDAEAVIRQGMEEALDRLSALVAS